MRVISFYSYKGGTGRTLLVANLAVYAARLGCSVVMVDLDLEAPGLAYKVLPSPPNRPGVLEWLSAPRRPDIEEVAQELEVSHRFNPGGELRLVGAGPPPSMRYLREVRELQSTAFGEESARGVEGMLELRDSIDAHFNPDLLLLDARTGISNTNAITTRVLADDVVALTLNTREQLEGTREVLRSLAPLTKPRNSGEQLGLHVVISRITDPERGVDDTQRGKRDTDIAASVRRFLTEPATPLTATLALADDPLLLHNDVALAADEHLLLAQRTNPNPSRTLHFDYLRIAQRLLGAEILAPAVAQAFSNIDDVQRIERAEFFGDVGQLLQAKAPQPSSEVRPASGSDRAGLKRKVSLLRRAVKTDSSRRPELAEALVELAWATFDARTPSTSNGLSFLRDAERIYRKLAKSYPAAYRPIHIDSLVQYSAMAAELGQTFDAQAAAAEAVDIATAAENNGLLHSALVAKALTNLAGIRYGVGELALAAEPARRATAMLEELTKSSGLSSLDIDLLLQIGAAFNQRAVIEATLGNSETARSSAQTAVAAYRAAGDNTTATTGLARALNNLANIYRDQFEFLNATAAAQEAVAVLGELAAEAPQNYLRPLAMAAQTLSASQADSGEHSQALQTAEYAVHLWRDLAEIPSGQQDVAGLVGALNNAAARYGEVGNLREAQRAAAEAVAVSDRTEAELRAEVDPDERLLRSLSEASAPAWANLAIVYRRSGEPELALRAAERARAIYTSLGSRDHRYIEVTLTIADLLLTEGQFDDAFAAALEAIKTAAGLGLPVSIATAHGIAARARIPIDPLIAIEHAQRSLDIFTEISDLTGQAIAVEDLARAYEAAGKDSTAQKLQERATQLRNAIVHSPSGRATTGKRGHQKVEQPGSG